MRRFAIFPILVLPVVITACQQPSARNIDVTLDAKTTEKALNEVAAEDTSIANAIDQAIDSIDDESGTETAQANDTVAALNPPPEPETPPPSLNPDKLVGIKITELIRRLGEPDYKRIDAEVEVYQYRLKSCVVDFVAMPRSEGQPLVVTSSHRRHRIVNTAYDAPSCHLDLGALDQDSISLSNA